MTVISLVLRNRGIKLQSWRTVSSIQMIQKLSTRIVIVAVGLSLAASVIGCKETPPPQETAPAGSNATQANSTMPAESTIPERRIALVVGNSHYRDVSPLKNPRNDARLIAKSLKSVGFELVDGGPQLDLDKTSFDRVIQDFGNALQGATAALFYYAGHGLQINDSNYLIPTSANPTRVSDVDFQMVN